jgi:hypothetical protein
MRNKPDSKVLVSYLPKLKAKDNTTKTSIPKMSSNITVADIE